MPKRTDIKKVLVIGSGPIVIGQAAEFDYAGTQACLALREEGYEVVLANSNPATIMTDTTIADKVYMEPLTLEYLARICRYERPDAIVPGIGGQTGLNLAMQLAKKGVLKDNPTEAIKSPKVEKKDIQYLSTEEIERLTFAPWATFSDASRGRARPEPQDPIRPVFQRDRDRVIHCKAFHRLKQKTQVFLSPEGDLYRTRLTHTLEVAQIARTIARALRLNEDLTEAISLAHDLGHTPFGHAGESALNRLCPGGFSHYRQSLRVVDKLEQNGRGLNLTWEVRNGIITHTKGTWAATPEGRIVRMADQIAFVNHDIEDAVRAGVLDPAILPRECTAVLGETKSQRITTMIQSILAHSDGDVAMGAEEEEAFLALKDFMYANVYNDRTAKREEQKVEKVLTELYEYYLTHIDQMSNFYLQLAYQEGRDRAVTDYISGMSDEFAIRTFEDVFVPRKWPVL